MSEPLCPYCLETVNANARRCRHCGSDLHEASGQQPDSVTYVVDRGLIRYGKFVLGVLAVFVVFGTYIFGFEIKDLVKEMEDLEERISEETTELNAAKEQLDSAMTELKSVQDRMREAQNKLESAQESLKEKEAALAETVEQTIESSEDAKDHLATIEAHLIKAGLLVDSLQDLHDRTLTPEQKEVAEAARRELEESENGTTEREAKLWPVGQVLRVRFLEGSEPQMAAVKNGASQWEKYANVKFEFVSEEEDAEIRIEFEEGDGSWSYVGTDALALVPQQDEATMNFGWDVTTQTGQDTVLREFGHALGLIGEHMNPYDPIPWAAEAVYRYYSEPPWNWSRDMVHHNILRQVSEADYPGERSFDRDSVMMYPFPAGLFVSEQFKDGVTPRPGLSDSDKAYIAQLYPRDS